MTHKTGQHFEIKAGVDISIDIDIEDALGGDISVIGASLKWVLSKHEGSAALVTKFDDSAGGITFDSEGAGNIKVNLKKADTLTLSGTHFQELLLIDSSGNESIVTTGYGLILPRST